MILEVQEGSFSYRKGATLFKDVSFWVKQGEIMTILGQNGIGKTTLLKCLMGLLKWEKGKTIIDGKPFTSLIECTSIAYVPQAHRTVFPFSVFEMVSMGRARHVSLFGLPSKLDKEKVEQALKTVGIEHLKNQLCSELSGGQLQLVYIARALVNDPALIIMDEPESHLDFSNQHLILRLIKELADKKGISCIINTHYPDHALNISDSTLILGKDHYLYGNSEQIITEQNMKKMFNVNVRILSVPEIDEDIRAFAVVG